MTKFIIVSKTLCDVDWYYEIEAESQEQALNMLMEEGPDSVAHSFGETCDSLEPDAVITADDPGYADAYRHEPVPPAYQELLAAAKGVLENAIDTGAAFPDRADAEADPESFTQDEDGDWWHLDYFALMQAIEKAAARSK